MRKHIAFNDADPKATLTRELHPKATMPPADTCPNCIDFRSSDETLDRYDEMVTASGWQLDNYKKNPVVQNAHSYACLSDTIGKSLITEVRSGAPLSPAGAEGQGEGASYLFQRVQFAVNENPLAKLAYNLYKGGFLNAVSVGFIPIRWENGANGADYRRKYLEQELLEVSAVSIPANPNALTCAFEQGAMDRGDLHELAAFLKTFCSEPAERLPDTRTLGAALNEVRLLQLSHLLTQTKSLLRR